MIQIEWFPPTIATEVFLLTIAFILSATIGLERERQLKSAGVRTHTLVGLGSALFTIVSAYGFASVTTPDAIIDPTRIAAQIVSGVGFLGAGVIFVRQNAVTGLTTAASIWVAAAIGMACGAGMPIVAVVATAFHLLTVMVLSYVGRAVQAREATRSIVVRYKESVTNLEVILRSAQDDNGLRPVIGELQSIERPGKSIRVQARLAYPRAIRNADGLITRLGSIPGVVSAASSRPEND